MQRLNPRARRAVLYGSALVILLAGLFLDSRLEARASLPPAHAGPTAVQGLLGGRRLPAALAAGGLSGAEAAAAANALARAVNARRLSPKDGYRVVRSPSGELLHVTYVHGLKRVVLVPDGAGGFKTAVRPVAVVSRSFLASGPVGASLWASMDAAGVPADVIAEFIEAFRWTVDFLTETREGDRFAVSWSEARTEQGRSRGRVVEAAVYRGPVAGTNTALLFDGEYFDEKGESLRRRFLRAPLKFSRVSSRFSSGRWHPVLRLNRPHHGTDYAAPTGTPVYAVADGVVTAAKRERGFGNVVKIRHDGTYGTLYAHLSRFARGMRSGARVRQGSVIGYVGATGLATGPHLHFQIDKNGRWVDFLRLDLPFAHPVRRARRAAFEALRTRLLPALGEA